MRELLLIGIGTGNPDHVTGAAAKAMNRADLILIPRKGEDKADLAGLRRQILSEHLTNPATEVVEFDLPVRDAANPDYEAGVIDWHDAIAAAWVAAMEQGGAETVALLVWGDPSLYDSTLRIADRLNPAPKITVIPGITATQALTAAHAIPVNEIGAPYVVTTGRRLRDEGWPEGADTAVVMLDGQCSFRSLDPAGFHIWWGAYVGMKEEVLRSGRLADVADDIVETRAKARAAHGWIMDVYLLRRTG